MSTYAKPLPKPSPISRPFWEAAKRHELLLQRCEKCRRFIYYPRPLCPNCMSDKLEWQRCSGLGKVHSFTVVHRASSRAFADAPYVLAIVELAEGPRITTNIAAAPETIRVEMPVKVFFDDVTPDRTLVKFKPAA
jgi:uncharacterized OB-fold protein